MRYLDILEAKVDQGKSKLDKIRARTRRKLEPGDPLEDKKKSGLRGEAARNREIRRGRLTQASRDEMSKRLRDRIRKSVQSATNEARTIPRQRGGGYSKKTTSSDRRVSPTEKSLEGEGLSRAEYRRRMMKKLKAEAYIQLGDVLAEAISSAVLGSQETRDKRRKRREAVSKGREEKTKRTKRVRDLKKEYRSLGRENSDLRNIKYREDEVKETEG